MHGARFILQKLANIRGGWLRYSFLYTWFMYHEILGNFSDPLRQNCDGPTSLLIRRDVSFDTSLVSQSQA